MKAATDVPFEYEALAEYLERGKSILYLTGRGEDEVKNGLARLGVEREVIDRRLSFRKDVLPDKGTGNFASPGSGMVMSDSLSGVFRMKLRTGGKGKSCVLKDGGRC